MYPASNCSIPARLLHRDRLAANYSTGSWGSKLKVDEAKRFIHSIYTHTFFNFSFFFFLFSFLKLLYFLTLIFRNWIYSKNRQRESSIHNFILINFNLFILRKRMYAMLHICSYIVIKSMHTCI